MLPWRLVFRCFQRAGKGRDLLHGQIFVPICFLTVEWVDLLPTPPCCFLHLCFDCYLLLCSIAGGGTCLVKAFLLQPLQ
jgi:hypothetical protein